MKVEITLTTQDEAYIIKNMYPLYLHDLAGHYGLVQGHIPNAHGIFEEEDSYKTLADQYEVQSIWWTKPGCLYPHLIRVDQNPAGFALVATPPHCAQGVDYFMNDFFVLSPYRGQGVAEQAAIQVFDQFKGQWELFTNSAEKNVVGQRFWRRTIAGYTQGNFDEVCRNTFDGVKMVFGFDNEK
ncbi:GNAT family N-acetyltransferase [Paenibacillus sp. N1-5-1-14]|uniref:GNAT family N-acetyltransferase n=1 Tax=Paenibacillus radicibacter TaxID=2972488 RepID=UPI002159A2C7|nr:GNAT family N-acetyltransferase [Paenibacillus radicibacter]MCR8642586.1 GNAT family N-acetyltransferase [Paenibacillus radicibacter]